MQDIPHIIGDMTEPWNTTNEVRGRAQDPLQAPQPPSGASVERTAIVKASETKEWIRVVVALVVRERETTELIIAVATELVDVQRKADYANIL